MSQQPSSAALSLNPDHDSDQILLRYLNPLRTREEVLKSYFTRPNFSDDIRALAPMERLTFIDDFRTIMTPRPEYADLNLSAELAMRAGYKRRNPEAVQGKQHLYAALPDARSFHGNLHSGAGGSIMVMGVTGAGKSSWAMRTANLQPTVIDLNRLTDGQYPYLQVPFLYVRCPSEPTVQGMVHSFLDSLELALADPQMISTHRRVKFTVSSAQQTITKLCRTYFIGMIIWDEFQAIVNANGRGNTAMNNFLMYIRDTAKVPMMYVGNYEMWSAFENNALILRRSTNGGARWLDRFEDPADAFWNVMVKTYWESQIVRNPQPLTEGIRRQIYDYTQGMPDYLRGLMFGAHRVALTSSIETIDHSVLSTAWDIDCAANHGPVAALKSGKLSEVRAYQGLMNPAKKWKR